MTNRSANARYLNNAVSTVVSLLAIPLWLEFAEPGQTIWNIILALLLVGAVVGTHLGVRYLRTHAIEVGEARFDTRNHKDR